MASELVNEPDWFYGTLKGVPSPKVTYSSDYPIQEDDRLKPFLYDISEYGLNYAYRKYEVNQPDDEYKHTQTNRPKNVIIVGAGMSGLVAGYELAQVGHEVQILELQHRVGGRIKTVSDEKFFPGQWADAGAMRLPGTGLPDWEGPAHFMTDFYAQKFQLPLKNFVNACDEGYYSFYGDSPIKNKDWYENPGFYCNKYWPGWRATIDASLKENPRSIKENIADITQYWDATVKPIRDQLYDILNADPNSSWEPWVSKWSSFSIIDLLRCSFHEIIKKLQDEGSFEEGDRLELRSLKHLLPWPLDAVAGLKAIIYMLSLDVSLVDWLRDELGQWWIEPMHTFKDGMQMLPKAFAEPNTKGWNTDVDLSKNITFGVQAKEIRYSGGSVTVVCQNQTTKKTQMYTGDSVIITLPMNIIRQTVFTPALPKELYKAMDNISYSPSTKILLQCKTQFWQEHGIDGGFTKTNMPIGQLHYPSNAGFITPQNERGVLMCYTWKQDALLFGSQKPDDAIAEAVEQISVIHPDIYDHFEVGDIQAWYNEPTAQGGFCFPRPEEYIAQKILYKPHQNIFFCGEALSTSNGWIQGALVSGLRSAYQFYAHNEKLK